MFLRNLSCINVPVPSLVRYTFIRCRLLLALTYILRTVLNIPKSIDILDHIYALPDEEQEIAMEKVREIERRGMEVQKPQAGLLDLMAYLDSRGVPKAICTRNFEYVPILSFIRDCPRIFMNHWWRRERS